MKKLVLIFHHFEKEHLGKDVFLVPYYLGKKTNMEVTIIYPETKTNIFLNSSYRGVKFKTYCKCKFRGAHHLYTLFGMLYLLKQAKSIDLLMTFHFVRRSAFYMVLYKLLNPVGKSYVKLDIPMFIVNQRKSEVAEKSFRGFFTRLLYNQIVKKTDLFSCETEETFTTLCNWNFNRTLKSKLVLMPNGFDEEERERLGVSIKDELEKENIFITVGRLGSNQKNTQLLLEAIAKIKVGLWKFILVGPIEDEFNNYVEHYFRKYPQLTDKVLLIGSIHKKKLLWEYYNKAKVFILTSSWESYGLVLNEALRFNNYIISTRVGVANDIINGINGVFIEQNSVNNLSYILAQIIKGEVNISKASRFDKSKLFWSNQVNKIVERL